MKKGTKNLVNLIFISLIFIYCASLQAQTSFSVSNKTTGDTLLTIDNTGRVGIGTTSPAASIDIRSAVESGATFNLGTFDDSHYLYLHSGRGGSSPLSPVMIWQEGDPMRFASWGTQYNEYMRISEVGYVGIGTIAPTTMLEVADTIYSTSGGFKFPDGSVQQTAASISGADGFLSSGTFGSGSIPVEGAGTRMMWYPAKAAFRVGQVTGSQWDDAQIGNHSIGIGYNTTASGSYSIAIGGNNTASATAATALGASTRALGLASTTMGNNTEAEGAYSTAMGAGTVAYGVYSMAMGHEIEARGSHTFAIALSDQNGLQVTQDTTMAIMGGRVGIGTISPTTKLEVADTIYSSVGGFKFPDGSVQETAAGSGSGNTLDQAYNQGGAGAGRTITADAGAFEVLDRGGVLFTGVNQGNEGPIPAEGWGDRMIWWPGKNAFRAGGVYSQGSTYWDADSIGYYSVAIGENTKAKGSASVALGFETSANGPRSTAFGNNTRANGGSSTAMGRSTNASGDNSTVMGRSTNASGDYSTAMGSYVNTSGTGSFVIGDNSTTTAPTFSTDNRFNARFANGYNLYTNSGSTIGVTLAASGNSWSSISDSSKKENFKSVDGEEFLHKIGNFKLTSWNYKSQDPSQHRHYGPMAQDFYAAFGNDGIGTIGNDTTIASADFDGINFIAIQALEKRTSDLQKENTQIKEELSMLKSKIEKFESLFSKVEELTNQNKKQFAKNEDNSK